MMNKVVFSWIIFCVMFAGCKTTQSQTKKKMNKTEKGAVIGGSSGAVIGGIIGNKKNNTALGAILGAAVGGTIGVIIGNKMDKQAKKIQDDLGKAATVERVGEGIKVTFDSQLLFDFGKTDVKEANREDLRKLAETLTQNPNTNLLIVGHTDDVGSASFNQTLSKNRARAVSYQLTSAGVSSRRLKVEGKGESQPTASNETDFGRSQNRRVEIAIYANDKMKTEAQKEVM
ncbi:OmpA family protein [Emticicia sp. SJ17W-69]|uniref:OmpA family protein n=1 Tax=Emticicia sp. SJ17W-69 TaxID=3421657 RepID=UPI003EC0C238